MSIVTILNPSICSPNLGDQIIIDSVQKILEDIFVEALFIHIQTQDIISKNSYKFIRQSQFSFVGGTNLLSSNMNFYNQWKVNGWDSLFMKEIILMGVGWWQYQKQPNLYTKLLLTNVLNKKKLHSVRDSYTEKQLKSIGISNVVNTSCPTMWGLTEEHCAKIPEKKSDAVLVTFTEYNQNSKYDSQLLNLLTKKYNKIYFWTQQPKDYEYMYNLAGDKVTYVSPNVKALDVVLNSEIDYVGTRLHAGIRALQHQKRSLILSVDNRALEIAKDTHLPVLIRDDLEAIAKWIDSNYKAKIKLPLSQITEWKNQFN